MMQSANNGHHHPHSAHMAAAAAAHHAHYPHLDPRYAMADYAGMAHAHTPSAVGVTSPTHDAHLAAHYALPPTSSYDYGMKRDADSAGLDMMGHASSGGPQEADTPTSAGGVSSDDDSDIKPNVAAMEGGGRGVPPAGRGKGAGGEQNVASGKKTKGRVKIKMEFIDNKLRRYTTFSKRKTGIMKKVS